MCFSIFSCLAAKISGKKYADAEAQDTREEKSLAKTQKFKAKTREVRSTLFGESRRLFNRLFQVRT